MGHLGDACGQPGVHNLVAASNDGRAGMSGSGGEENEDDGRDSRKARMRFGKGVRES